jgi:hypothetical protein
MSLELGLVLRVWLRVWLWLRLGHRRKRLDFRVSVQVLLLHYLYFQRVQYH